MSSASESISLVFEESFEEVLAAFLDCFRALEALASADLAFLSFLAIVVDIKMS